MTDIKVQLVKTVESPSKTQTHITPKTGKIINITDNKKQLFAFLYDDLASTMKFLETAIGSNYRLIING